MLPLLDAGREVSKALTVMVTDRAVTDGPRRFALTNAVSLSAYDTTQTPQRRMSDLPLPVPAMCPEMHVGMAEAAEPFAPRVSPVPWLRVVK